jgi:hypothetical protein
VIVAGLGQYRLRGRAGPGFLLGPSAHADGTDLNRTDLNLSYLILGVDLSNQYPTANPPEVLIEGEDYYFEDGLLVMTAAYHKKRGSCCGNECRWCPFEPSHEAGVTKLAADRTPSSGDGARKKQT